jgi:hypothetical protein
MTVARRTLAVMTADLSPSDLAAACWPGTLQINTRADIRHILQHASVDEPSGTWTGGACQQHGRALGADVDLADLGEMHRQSAGLIDVTWSPEPAAADTYLRLIREWHADGDRQPHQHPFDWWAGRVETMWSYIWSANYRSITEIIERPARSRGAAGFLIASFEHNSSAHGLEQPHIHNLMPQRRELSVSD